jgi:translation elongation factor EF-G
LPMGEHNSIKNINMIKIQEEILRIPVESALNMGIEGLAFIGIEVSIKRNDLGNPPAIMDQIKFYELIKERLLSVAQYEQMEPMVAADISSPPQYTGEILRDLYANRFGTLISQDDKCQKVTNVKAIMPLETSIGYATWLRGLSSGNATLAIHNIGYIAGKI